MTAVFKLIQSDSKMKQDLLKKLHDTNCFLNY
jgi:hypothetical protein